MHDENGSDDCGRVRVADGVVVDRAGVRAGHVALVKLHARTKNLGFVGQLAGECRSIDDLARAALNPILRR